MSGLFQTYMMVNCRFTCNFCDNSLAPSVISIVTSSTSTSSTSTPEPPLTMPLSLSPNPSGRPTHPPTLNPTLSPTPAPSAGSPWNTQIIDVCEDVSSGCESYVRLYNACDHSSVFYSFMTMSCRRTCGVCTHVNSVTTVSMATHSHLKRFSTDQTRA